MNNLDEQKFFTNRSMKEFETETGVNLSHRYLLLFLRYNLLLIQLYKLLSNRKQLMSCCLSSRREGSIDPDHVGSPDKLNEDGVDQWEGRDDIINEIINNLGLQSNRSRSQVRE